MTGPMLASDAQNPQFVGAHNPDSALVVQFYSKAVHQPYESALQGRPIYLDVDYVKIFTPGSQLNIIDTPVRQEHKRRFAQQWAAYEQGKGSGIEMGTPLTQWPLLSSAQAQELRGVKFLTVEQIANASDGQLQGMGMIAGMNPLVLRDRARAFLQAAAGTAPTDALAKENAELKQMMQDMQRQMAAIQANTPQEAPKRRGRKPKEPVTEE